MKFPEALHTYTHLNGLVCVCVCVFVLMQLFPWYEPNVAAGHSVRFLVDRVILEG